MDIAIQLTNMTTRDKLAATYMIGLHNAPIIVENARKAALTPPEAAAPILPFGTASELKTSYEAVFVKIDQAAHDSYVKEEANANGPNKQEWKDAFAIATAVQRAAGLAALKA